MMYLKMCYCCQQQEPNVNNFFKKRKKSDQVLPQTKGPGKKLERIIKCNHDFRYNQRQK